MPRKLAGLIVCGTLIAGCGQPTARPTKPIADADGKTPATSAAAASGQFALEDFVVGEPVQFENLTVFPVASRVPKTDDRFITLDEGLKAGTVEIHELAAAAGQSVPSPDHQQTESEEADPFGEGIGTNEHEGADPFADNLEANEHQAADLVDSDLQANDVEVNDVQANDVQANDVQANDVNSLSLVNHSDKPLYLMPGEVIIGGSQDRTIGDELVIAAHSQPTKVPVFCVEHGRWGRKGAADTLAQLRNAGASQALSSSVSLSESPDQTLDQVARQADDGKFVATVGHLGKSARLAVQSDKDQSAVWDKVAETNVKSGVRPASGAFTANYSNVETVQRLEPYLESLQSPIANYAQVVGVLVAINGKIESIDVFESTPLFQKVWPKLLKSYSLDAANAADDATQGSAVCTRATALALFAETLQASVASSDSEHGIGLVKRDGQHVLSFTSHMETPADAAAMGGMGGGMGGAVHVSGFGK